MLTLQFLICGSRGFEPVISQRHGARLRNHPRLHCSAYVCKDYAQFVELNKICVARPQRRLWCAIQVVDERGATFDPPNGPLASWSGFIGSQDDPVVTNPPFSGVGTGAPEKPPGGDALTVPESDPAPESLSSIPSIGAVGADPAGAGVSPPPPNAPAGLPPLPKPPAKPRIRNRAKSAKS